MKIRNGFVSNSSSSSFVVNLPKTIDKISLQELKEMLILDIGKTFEWLQYENRMDYELPVERCIEKLYEDMEDLELSKPDETQTWFYDKLGRKLEATEYVVEYADNEGYIDDIMENEFMPQVKLVNAVFSWH